MNKLYGIAYKNEYTMNDIEDMVWAEDVRYWHAAATYWQPEEEDIDYNPKVSEDFDKIVKIFSVEFIDDNDENGRYLEIDGIKYLLMVPWYESLEKLGYNTTDDRILEGFMESEQEAKNLIEEWQLNRAEEAAWEIVKNGEARSWY